MQTARRCDWSNLLYCIYFCFSVPNKTIKKIEVYDIDSFQLRRRLTVPGLIAAFDIVACERYGCAYVSNALRQSVHRVALRGVAITHWPVNDVPSCLSVTVKHNVLVTCRHVRKIKEFSSYGELLREFISSVASPWHTVQLSSGELIVCHGHRIEPLHRVCLISSDGQVVQSYGGSKGSGSQQVRQRPSHMAVDRDQFVFVVDRKNDTVLLLSPAVSYLREVLSREQLQWTPYRLSLDVQRRRLYVAVNKQHEVSRDFTVGRVIVVNV